MTFGEILCLFRAAALRPSGFASKRFCASQKFQHLISVGPYKGVVALNPELDKNPAEAQLRLRESMLKFPAENSCVLEIVKFSSPTPATLNRQLINVIQHVTMELSPDSVQDSVMNCLTLLNEQHLTYVADLLTSERRCAETLSNSSLRIDFKSLTSHGVIFDLTNEPFFRQLALAVHRKNLVDLQKQRIDIPKDYGRMMYGVIDETGKLKEGEVFVQYSKSCSQNKAAQTRDLPKPGGELKAQPIPKATVGGDVAERKIVSVLRVAPRRQAVKSARGYSKLPKDFANVISEPVEDSDPQSIVLETGRSVYVTKMPCVGPGDVRVLVARDVPELHHLIDVVVFSRQGERPEPDKMGGADLDGDEMIVIWLPELVPDKSYEPDHFPKYMCDDIEGEITVEQMLKFFAYYIENDSLGLLSNQHLSCSDQEGIFSEKAKSLARKCSLAVDFPKTGYCESISSDEKTNKRPDYLATHRLGNIIKKSQSLIGRLHRRVKTVSDIISYNDSTSLDDVVPDLGLIIPGWDIYKSSAIKSRNKYNLALRNIMDTHRIYSEGQLLSGSLVDVKNRFTERDREDFSYYNTEKLVEDRVQNLWLEFRKEFFQEEGWYGLEDFEANSEDLLNSNAEGLFEKASAWYVVTYDWKEHRNCDRFLSFPWIVWDLLKRMKMEAVLQLDEILPVSLPSQLSQLLLNQVDSCVSNTVTQLYTNIRDEIRIVSLYVNAYSEMSAMIKAVLQWSENVGCFDEIKGSKAVDKKVIDACSIALIFLHFAIYEHPSVKPPFPGDEFEDLTDNISDPLDKPSKINEVDWQSHECHPGEIVFYFLRWLGSQRFAQFLDNLSFDPEILESLNAVPKRKLMWERIHFAAFRSFHLLAVERNLKSLFLPHENCGGALIPCEEEIEFSIEWPVEDLWRIPSFPCLEKHAKLKQLCNFLKETTGISDIMIRRPNKNVNVSCKGSPESLRMAKQILTKSPAILRREIDTLPERSNEKVLEALLDPDDWMGFHV